MPAAMTDKICSNATEVRLLWALLRVCHTTMMSIPLLVRLSRTLNRFTHGFAPATVSRITFPITSGISTVMIWLRTKKNGQRKGACVLSTSGCRRGGTHVQKLADRGQRFARFGQPHPSATSFCVRTYVLYEVCILYVAYVQKENATDHSTKLISRCGYIQPEKKTSPGCDLTCVIVAEQKNTNPCHVRSTPRAENRVAIVLQ